MGSAWAQVNAETVAEIHSLLDQGKANDAAKVVSQQLKQHAGDVQLRFLQGVVAVEQKKYDQAIQLFTQLTRDYPSLPEPYNNLAVLHAIKGDDRKAAQVLEQAIGTNPSYATAHENLGDLYARMASDAYAKALQLDSSRQTIQPKLSLIKQIFPATASTPAVVAVPARGPAAPAASTVPTTSVPATAASVVSEAPVAAPTVAAAPVTPPIAVPVAQPAEPPAAAAAVPAADTGLTTEVERAVRAWAKAWAQQDMNAYYGAYSKKFEAPGGNLAQWKNDRKERIVGKPTITVDVRDLQIRLQGQNALASFRQHYASGSFKATTRKTLTLTPEAGQWRITREETGR